MPKQTFFKLKAEKREAIEAAAIKEFAARGYHGAKLNHIVENAGIAKGSFYQYFQDLEDLYTHLICTLTERKMEFINREIAEQQCSDFFSKIAASQRASLHCIHYLGEDVLAMTRHSIPSFVYSNPEFSKLRKESTDALYLPMIEEAIANGEISDNPDLAFSVLSQIGNMTRQYLMGKKDYETYIDLYLDEEAYIDASNLIIQFIKQGLKKP